MANTNSSNLSVNNLDFDTIKSNLKTYLQSQDKFSDYNFDGAGLTILLDILAYNSHLEGFYNNMIANEMFLDSAIKRDSIVSIAKHLGYTPTSKTASTAIVDINYGNTAGMVAGTSIVPIGSNFSASKDGVIYNFTNLSVGSIDPTASPHVTGLSIKEGRYTSTTFVYDQDDSDQRFIIPDEDVDTSTITVKVQTSPSDTTGYTNNWELSTDINDVTTTSKVYFLQEVESGKYEIYFGDDVIGQKLSDGNLITIKYLITNGVTPNDIGNTDKSGSRSFSYGTGNEVIVTSVASGGASRETLASIRKYAPRSYQAQDRAVTSEDYKSILKKDYPDVESINVWGGEDNDPPEYGKVFIAFKPISGTILTEETKDSIANTLISNKNIVAIDAKIVDPDFIYLIINTTINYNPRNTSLSEKALKALVSARIASFGDTNLEKFDKGLKYSKFIKDIDDTDTSILSNETSLTMEYRLYPNLNQTSSYEIKLGNALLHPYDGYVSSLSSSTFKYTDINNVEQIAYLKDNGYGKINIYYTVGSSPVLLKEGVGVIDYDSGTVNINNIKINSLIDNSFLKIKLTPKDKDIDSIRNKILIIDNTDSSAINLVMNQITTG
jgi:hypothetical protein